MYDVIFETQSNDIPGLVLSIDFEKAFDTVSWNFIDKALDYFNLGPSIKRWVKLFYNGAESCIIQNGFMSSFFKLHRGCRQGDPISPYIFLICAEILGQMLRKNKSIKGIVIKGTENKISQYADDTQIFLDGSEKSLKCALNTLDKFYKMSGLKMNIDKTKAIWIGAMSHSNLKLCENIKLDWEKGPFKILGVNFTVNVHDIWEHNYNDVLGNVEKVLNSWRNRKLTLFGKVTIIKSLALSKFVHLFLALPNPPGELLKTLDKIFYKFLWNNGPDRIKRSILIKNLKNGGLQMIKTEEFIKSLKISWLRRVLNKNQKWSTQSGIEFKKAFLFGDLAAKHIAQETENPFWKNTLEAWSNFMSKKSIKTIDEIFHSPIWLNSKMEDKGNLIFKNWSDKGINLIIDLLDENSGETGYFLTFEDLKSKFNINGTFLEYQRVIKAIPGDWKTAIKNTEGDKINIVKYEVKRSTYVSTLMKSKKGCRDFYETLVGPQQLYTVNKWTNEFGNVESDLKFSYSLLKETHAVKVKDFQYKILHNILVTNSFLKKIGKVDSDLCSYCKIEKETTLHILCTCEKVKDFWLNFEGWLLSKFNININLSRKNIIFSSAENNRDVIINHLITLGKYYIYKTKFYQQNLSLSAFHQIVKKDFITEKYIALTNHKAERFNGKWSVVYNFFNDLEE